MKKEKKPANKDESIPEKENFINEFFQKGFRNNRFGFFDEFEEQFKRMEQQMNALYRQALQGNRQSDHNNNMRFYGWKYHVGPDGQPHYQEFGNLPEMLKQPQQKQLHDGRNPHIDFQEDDKKIYITAELPGVDKEDIHLEIDNNTLKIQVNNDTYPYQKDIPLQTEINEKNIDAAYNNGILSLTLEKKKPIKKGRKIKIK